MIDSLVHFRAKAKQSSILNDLGADPKSYVLMTMHRPANVDHKAGLEDILTIIENTAAQKPVIFPMHPRTAKSIERHGLQERLDAIQQLSILEPLGYLEFLCLMDNAFTVITDSGGIQEETTFLQVPCLTFRDTTERPITTELGTNTLLQDLNPQTVHEHFMSIVEGTAREGVVPPLWDGQTSERIADHLLQFHQTKG